MPAGARWQRREVYRRGPYPGRRPRRLAGRPRRRRPRTGRRAPARRARAGSRRSPARAGIGDGTTVVVYDDTQGLYAARVWWTLRAYGARVGPHPRRRLPGLGGRGPADQRGTRSIRRAARLSPFTPRGPNRMQPDDVRRARRCSGRPDVHAARCPRAGRIPRLRGQHAAARPHPGRGQRARSGRCTRPGSQRLRDGGDLRDRAARRERQPRPADGRLRRLGRGGGEARLRPDACSATRTSRSTTAAGPSGATGWTCRSTASAAGAAGRLRPSGAARALTSRSARGGRLRSAARRRRSRPSPAHGSTTRCGARICARSWLTATSSRRLAAPRRACPTSTSPRSPA